MPASTDLYFPPDDLKSEAALIPGAVYKEMETKFGHIGGKEC
jgi:hypothetical protein